MATFLNPPLAYGLSQPTIPVMPLVGEIDGIPTAQTRGVLGQMLLNRLAPGNIYMLTGIIAGLAQWTLVAGGAGSFNSLVVTTTITAGGDIASTGGNIVADTGDIVTLVGDFVSGAGITFITNITSPVGNIILTGGNISTLNGDIVATTGNIAATIGNVSAGGNLEAGNNVYSFGDDGSGTTASTSFTNVVDTTQGAGTLTITSASANPGTNTGFLKFYVGTTPVFVPYFDTIAP